MADPIGRNLTGQVPSDRVTTPPRHRDTNVVPDVLDMQVQHIQKHSLDNPPTREPHVCRPLSASVEDHEKQETQNDEDYKSLQDMSDKHLTCAVPNQAEKHVLSNKLKNTPGHVVSDLGGRPALAGPGAGPDSHF